MNMDFFRYPLHEEAYSGRRMAILDPQAKELLSAITEVALLETGNRSSRERWQQLQLRNLFNHAIQRSAFWRARIGSMQYSQIRLASVPILTRQDLQRQVSSEGPLLRDTDRIATDEHFTSGSSGTPVRFFISEFNAHYNQVRSLAQYFIEGRDLSLNRTRVRLADAPIDGGISVETDASWIGALASVFRSGKNKHIEYHRLHDKAVCAKLVEELKKNEIGYFMCPPRVMDTIFSQFDLGFLRDAGVAIWVAATEPVENHLLNAFKDLNIPIRQNYSSEEIGMIGAECDNYSGNFHVATSNVLVEIFDPRHELNGSVLGNVLVTHLHSYASPLIRYDLGDLASLLDKCPCGYDGPTLCNLHGRATRVIKHRDGRVSPLYINVKELSALLNLTEYRLRQTAFEKLIVDIGGRTSLTHAEIAALTEFFKERVGQEFEIQVNSYEEIDWGQSRKKYGLRCEI